MRAEADCWDRTEAALMAEPEYDNGICSGQPKRAEAGLRGSLRNQAAEGELFTPTEIG